MSINEVCCTCLVSKTPLLPIFRTTKRKHGNISLFDFISDFTSTRINSKNKNAIKICSPCEETLHSIWDFKDQACQALKLLHQCQSQSMTNSILVQFKPIYLKIVHHKAVEESNGTELKLEPAEPTPNSILDNDFDTKSENDLEADVEASENIDTNIAKSNSGDELNTLSKSDKIETFSCPVCSKSFKTSRTFNAHKRLHSRKNTYNCEYCGRACGSPSKLKEHLVTHTGDRPHICDICGRSFSQRSVLRTHRKLHTGRSDFCPICNKGFCRSSFLKAHMRTHTGEKPYLCPECGQSFLQSSHLNQHQMTQHTTERRFKCDICFCLFKHKSSLCEHQLRHAKQKRFQCTLCSYACYREGRLMQHTQRVHNGTSAKQKPFECRVCTKKYLTKSLLNSHVKSAHWILQAE